MVSHQDAVPTPSKAIAGVPGCKKEEGEQSEGHDDLPGNREPVGKLGDKEEKRDEADGCCGHPELDPQVTVQFWHLRCYAVAQETQGQAVEIAEPMIQGVVAVVVPGRTAQTLVPFSCKGHSTGTVAAPAPSCFYRVDVPL